MTTERKFAPIAVFLYRRPERARNLIDSLLTNPEAAKSDLFLFSDGAKTPDAEDDVHSMREFARTVSGFKSVTLVERETNYGLAKSVIGGASQLCDDYGRVIALEEDLIVSPHFLAFINDGLDRYVDEDSVKQIAGHLFGIDLTCEEDAVFLPLTSSLGWATWDRAWREFDADAKGYDALKNDPALRHKFDLNGSYPYFNMLEDQLRGKVDSWAIRWHLSVFMKSGLVLYPKENMVVHEGWDEKATHAKRDGGHSPNSFDLTFVVKKYPEVFSSPENMDAISKFFGGRKKQTPFSHALSIRLRKLLAQMLTPARSKGMGFIYKMKNRLMSFLTDHMRVFRSAPAVPLPGGYERIYHVHIRKTGGTSLNKMFIALSDEERVNENYNELANSGSHVLNVNQYSYVGWDGRKIFQGNYFYGFSHIPLWQLSIPKNTFIITCLRDPVARLLSHYKMLTEYRDSENPHVSFEREKHWLGGSFQEFLTLIPKPHRLCQLYMFSETFDVDEAVNAINRCGKVLVTENMSSDVADLNVKLGLNLISRHERKSAATLELSESDYDAARAALADEYEFFKRIGV